MLDCYMPADLSTLSDASLRWDLQHPEVYSLGLQDELRAEARRRGWTQDSQAA